MQQDNSNGSSSFEMVDKQDQSGSNDKSDTLSTLSAISSPYSISSPSPTGGSLSASGNILSNVAPPSSIPDFTLWTTAESSTGLQSKPNTVSSVALPPQTVQPGLQKPISAAMPVGSGQFPTTQFSAAIPPSKGIPQEATSKRAVQPPEAEVADTPGIIGMVQGALSSGVLYKMAEKAKSSVNSLITTLDPQMSEYLYSGGDIEITVASADEEIVGAVREAVHSVLGKAWVNGIKFEQPQDKSQAIGLKTGFEKAEAQISICHKQRQTPIVAVENVLINENESWFDVSVLLLKDFEKGITLKTISQGTPVPTEKFLEQINGDKKDPSASIEKKLSEYLKIIPGWQEEVSGVSRKEIILLAAKTLVKLYKDELNRLKPK